MYQISPQQHSRSVTVLATQFQTEHKLLLEILELGFWIIFGHTYYVMEKKCIHRSTFQNMSKSSQDTSHYIGKVQF